MAAAEDELAIRRVNQQKAQVSKAEAHQKLLKKIAHFEIQFGRLGQDLNDMRELADILKP